MAVKKKAKGGPPSRVMPRGMGMMDNPRDSKKKEAAERKAGKKT